MSDWEPKDYSEDPMVNAVLNVAAAIEHLATATNGLLYGLKYSKDEGTSVAEAIENVGDMVQGALADLASAVRQDEP